jgi:hypothetical protein
MKSTIHLGFETGTGRAVEIPLSHLIVTGVTQLSGKTTTLEALITRSGLDAIVFKTKPGEKGFSEGAVIPPFFREHSDWQYVTSLLEATLNERVKFQRSWIMRSCKGTSSLLEVKRNIEAELANPKVTGLNRSIYTELEEYFKLILPQLSVISFSRSLDIASGLNIMDLTRMSVELQSLVIRSVLETVLSSREGTIVIIPECWSFLPQGRGNPVKRVAEQFIRQGATNHNFLWLDSQDISSVDKTPLKQVSTWILGIQSERNEVQHTIDQMPIPKRSRPPVDEIMTLEVGHFFACTPSFTKKTYVQPAWMTSTIAEGVARGALKSKDVKPPATRPPQLPASSAPCDMPATEPELRIHKDLLGEAFGEINRLRSEMNIRLSNLKAEILASLPKNGSAVYEIAPLKMLQRKCLEEAKAFIFSQIGSLTDDQRKILRFVESAGTGVKQKDVIEKCLGLSSSSGGTNDKVKKLAIEMNGLGLIRRDDRIATSYPNLMKRVESDLSIHSASADEIQSVYDHLIAGILD